MEVEKASDKKMKSLRTGNSGICFKRFLKIIEAPRHKKKLTVPYMPQQNGCLNERIEP